MSDFVPSQALAPEVARRRTLAIVSHPDAGKTTLTEKLLLYGGAIQLAGSVTERRSQRATASDWLELEKKRGISISSTVLPFEYAGYRINLLDTPGHRDFSDDTYRVLTAVDAAIMVLDASKGIEAQTQKLFEICRQRKVPIFTFINKLDRPARNPLELLDQLEEVLGIAPYPVNWPLGSGPTFRGVWDRSERLAHLFERTPGGAFRAPVFTASISDPTVRERLDDQTYLTVLEELEILEAAGSVFEPADVLAAKTTPVYFGSAANNFGVELLLNGFLKYSPEPLPRKTTDGRTVEPTHPAFSGFVFKIQANMDPQHRDRVAFVRVVSGAFQRNMSVTHPRTGKKVRLANASTIFGAQRETVEEAYAGDVVGIVGNSGFAIGDTLSEDSSILFSEVPIFAPESFSFIESTNSAEAKRFRSGLDQLLQEGVTQMFEVPDVGRQTPLLGAAGPLQFEIVQYRLESEYGASSRLRPAPWTMVRWIDPATAFEGVASSNYMRYALDSKGHGVLLFENEWGLRYFSERNPAVGLMTSPFNAEQAHLQTQDLGRSAATK